MSRRNGTPGPLAEAAGRAVRRLVRAVVAEAPGGHLVEDDLSDLEVAVSLVLAGPEAEPEAVARRLRSAVERAVEDAVQRNASFRPGHAFCHRCRSAACRHSEPPGSRHVFVGYAPTGVPAWEDLAQHCLDRRHPEVDRLFANPPVLLTLVRRKGELLRGLLPAFQAPACELIGQLLAGFFSAPVRHDEGRGVVALSFQVLLSRPARGGPGRLGLNILGRSPGGGPPAELWERHREAPWRRPVRWAQSALCSVSPEDLRHPEVPARVEQRVGSILEGLARRLRRDRRSRARRTSHAEGRHEAGDRPTRKALDDAREAGPGAVLRDERSDTWVVLGDRGRAHFFAPDGRLVSSVRYSRDAIERKRKQGTWREVPADELPPLRARILDRGRERSATSYSE